MAKPKSYTHRIADAVEASDLPSHIRHLLVTMARNATHATGVGLHSQETIGRKMGVSDRQVRRYLDELEELASAGKSPIMITRTPRMRRDGRGRTSDQWRLVHVDQPDTSVRLESADQPDTDVRKVEGESDMTNRTSKDDQPDIHGTTNRTPTSGDPCRDPCSDPGRSSARRRARGSGATKRKGGKPKTQRTAEQSAARKLVTDALFAAFKEKFGPEAKPVFGPREGKSIWTLLDKLGGNADLAVTRIRNAVFSDVGGSTSINVIAADPDRFAELKRRDARSFGRPAPGPKQPNGGYRPPVEH